MAATDFRPIGAHLVGSVPLGGPEEVFRAAGAALGDRLRRLPDGETGPRADWIVWQYPVLSSRPQFEVAPPAPGAYRALPRLRLRQGAGTLELGELGYAEAAAASYTRFARLKRDGVIPSRTRFQVSLPTPLAPVSAFVALEDQDEVEQAYGAAMAAELAQIVAAIPHEQLAVQWDTNVEFGMIAGELPVWFGDAERGIRERLVACAGLVPDGVELGFHFCLGHDEQAERHVPADLGTMVDLANAVVSGSGRTLDWLHLPLPRAPVGAEFVAPLARLGPDAAQELYLGVIAPGSDDGEIGRRIALAREVVPAFGVATACGWGRFAPSLVPAMLATHARHSRPLEPAVVSGARFAWPDSFPRIPDEDWVAQPVDAFGLHYDTVENHGWYRNLDVTVEQLAASLRPGDVLIDYSGGTGILLDRLRLRIFDRAIGMLIVDSSPKFLRVALDRFRDDPRVAFRRIHYLKDERRLQYVDEVLGGGVRPADQLVSTNAIHLYDDLAATLAGWSRVLKPGGTVRIGSGNVRNPAAAADEWIIDETVYVVHEVAIGLVRTEQRWEAYRGVLEDPARMRAYLEYRDRVFLAPRPLAFYLDELRSAGFDIAAAESRTIEADVEEWYEFLATYADAVLGWVGGSAKVDGRDARDAESRDRLDLLHEALTTIFGGRPTFRCCWTYITATRA